MVDFGTATFHSHVWKWNKGLEVRVDFGIATFCLHAWKCIKRLEVKVDFGIETFHSHAWKCNIGLEVMVDFGIATYHSHAWRCSKGLEVRVDFGIATFCSHAWKCIKGLEVKVDFGIATFRSHAWLCNKKLEVRVDFGIAAFHSHAWLCNKGLEVRVDFGIATFCSHVCYLGIRSSGGHVAVCACYWHPQDLLPECPHILCTTTCHIAYLLRQFHLSKPCPRGMLICWWDGHWCVYHTMVSGLRMKLVYLYIQSVIYNKCGLFLPLISFCLYKFTLLGFSQFISTSNLPVCEQIWVCYDFMFLSLILYCKVYTIIPSWYILWLIYIKYYNLRHNLPSAFTMDDQGMSCHIMVEMYNTPDLNVQIRAILSNTYASQC